MVQGLDNEVAERYAQLGMEYTPHIKHRQDHSYESNVNLISKNKFNL